MTTIYHNPRCSKSRRALELLEQQGITPDVVFYLETPPDVEQLTALLRQLGISAKTLLRFGEDRAEELGVTENDVRSEQEWIALLAANPILIERPVIVHNGKAVIGRPPEKVLELLGR